MKKTFLLVLLGAALFLGAEQVSETQTKSDNTQSKQNDRPKIIALNSGEPDELTYDAGTVRFLASSEDTNGAWSLVELTEKPGYKTRVHRHIYTDEAIMCWKVS